jgi:L-asparaginase II
VELKDNESKILFQHGNINQMFYPRSSMKYIQILPLLESGCVDHFGFTDDEISIMCASHGMLIYLY